MGYKKVVFGVAIGSHLPSQLCIKSNSGRMSLCCWFTFQALLWLKEWGSQSATPWTSCAPCKMIALLLHRVQHLLISIMGYAPMHQANPGRECSLIWFIQFSLFAFMAKQVLGSHRNEWIFTTSWLNFISNHMESLYREQKNSTWASLRFLNPPPFASRFWGQGVKGGPKDLFPTIPPQL